MMVVSLLELNELLAAALVKLLSADGSVTSGVMVARMISQPSLGVGLRLRSPSPSMGESGRHTLLNGCEMRFERLPESE